MQTADGLIRVAREYVEDLAADGVLYGEVRWAPEQHLQAGLTLDAAVGAVQAGVGQGGERGRAQGDDNRLGPPVAATRAPRRAPQIAPVAPRAPGARVG